MANYRGLSFKSSKIGMLINGGLQRSSVLPIEHSLSQFQTWTFHFALQSTFLSRFLYGLHAVSMNIPCISTKYIHGIVSKDIHGISKAIHGISFDVCTWYIRGISTDIPSFLKPDFAAGPCCWSHSIRTHVWVIKTQSPLFHAPPWQLCQGKRRPTKGSTRLPPTLNLPPL